MARSELLAVAMCAVVAGCGADAGSSGDPNDVAAVAGGAGGGSLGGGGYAGQAGQRATDGGKGGAIGGSPGSGGATAGSGGSTKAATGGSTGSGGTSIGSGGTSNGTGGASGGTGGTPHVVGACDGLGAVDVFEAISPPGVSFAAHVIADPIHAGTIYVGTDKQGLHKSTNCGAAWSKVSTGANGANLDTGTLWSLTLDPTDPGVIYTGSLYAGDSALFKSTNGGVDWVSLFPAGSEVANTVEYNFFQDLSLDPTDHLHIVTTFHANCKGAVGPQCMAESKDGGATWRLFKGPLGGWSEGSAPSIIGGDAFILGTFQQGMWLTTDAGATWKQIGPGCHHNLYRATTGSYYSGGDYGVNRGTDNGRSWTLLAGTPHGTMQGDGIRIFISGTDMVYYTSAETDGNTWKAMTPPKAMRTAFWAHDPDHHVLYMANMDSGLYRMVTH